MRLSSGERAVWELLSEPELLHLARRGPGELAHFVERLGPLLTSQAHAREVGAHALEPWWRHAVAHPEHRSGVLAEPFVGRGDHADLRDGVDSQHELLDLLGADVL